MRVVFPLPEGPLIPTIFISSLAYSDWVLTQVFCEVKYSSLTYS